MMFQRDRERERLLLFFLPRIIDSENEGKCDRCASPSLEIEVRGKDYYLLEEGT